MESAGSIAVEAADGARLAVIDKNLEAFPRIRPSSDHHAGVGRPVGLHLEDEFEVGVRLIAHQVPAIAWNLGVLETLDGAVHHLPPGGMRPEPARRSRREDSYRTDWTVGPPGHSVP